MMHYAFEDEIERIVSKALVEARKSDEAAAALLECLSACIGLTVAVLSKGDAKASERMLAGLEHYITKESARTSNVLGKVQKQ